MKVHTGDNKLVITIGLETFHFDLPKNVGKNLMHKIDFIIKHNELLTGHNIKKEISQLLSKYKQGNDIHGHEKQHNE